MDTPNFGRRRLIFFVAILLAVVIIPVALYLKTENNKRDKVAIEIMVMPHDAVVSIDGQKSKAGEVYVTPGSHVFSAEREGFTSVDNEVSVSEGSIVTLILEAVSEEAKSYVRINERRYLEIEGAAGEAARQEGERFRQLNPIANVLPYEGVLFTINYRVSSNDPDQIIVRVLADSSRNRALAIERIRSMGYEPSDYQIEFVDIPGNVSLEVR